MRAANGRFCSGTWTSKLPVHTLAKYQHRLLSTQSRPTTTKWLSYVSVRYWLQVNWRPIAPSLAPSSFSSCSSFTSTFLLLHVLLRLPFPSPYHSVSPVLQPNSVPDCIRTFSICSHLAMLSPFLWSPALACLVLFFLTISLNVFFLSYLYVMDL